jgi:hypothetical protein
LSFKELASVAETFGKRLINQSNALIGRKGEAMSIQEREYMKPDDGKSNRQKQREYADKFKLEPPGNLKEIRPTEIPHTTWFPRPSSPASTDYNNQEHWDININKPKEVTRPASYNDVCFDESDALPGKDVGEPQGSLAYGLTCGLMMFFFLLAFFSVVGTK